MVSRFELDILRSLSQPLLAKAPVVCAWCKRELAPGVTGIRTTRGCCKECTARLLREAGTFR
jgi:hypothetical protein